MKNLFTQQFGTGNPVVLIHGFCETHEIWNEIAKALSLQYKVFIIDLPGFGQSSLPITPFSLNTIGQIVLDWIKQNNIVRPTVIGHSLGGYVALEMALQSKDIFSAIGLFHSTAFPDSEEKKANRNRVIEFVKKNGAHPFIETFVPGLFYSKEDPAIPMVYGIAHKTHSEAITAYSAAMRDRPSYVEVLKNFNAPVLLLGGDNDPIIPQEVMLQMSQLAKHPVYKILKTTGHMAMYEQFDQAKEVLFDFLQQPIFRGK